MLRVNWQKDIIVIVDQQNNVAIGDLHKFGNVRIAQEVQYLESKSATGKLKARPREEVAPQQTEPVDLEQIVAKTATATVTALFQKFTENTIAPLVQKIRVLEDRAASSSDSDSAAGKKKAPSYCSTFLLFHQSRITVLPRQLCTV